MTARNIKIILLLLIGWNTVSAQLNLNFSTSFNETNLKATTQISVENFSDIGTLQFSINYDENLLKFDSLRSVDLLGLNTTGNWSHPRPGEIIISWYDQTFTGVNLDDGSILLEIAFDMISQVQSEVCYSNSPLVLEFTNSMAELVPVNVNCGQEDGVLVKGTVFHDQNGDCLLDSEYGLSGFKVIVGNQSTKKVFYLNEFGEFETYLPVGTDYSFEIPEEYDLWRLCDPSFQFDVDLASSSTELEVGWSAESMCPDMEVSISTPRLRRCFENVYFLKYANNGSSLAENAIIQVELDPFLMPVQSSLPWTSQVGQILTFDLGDVQVGASGKFNLKVLLDCDSTVLGQTHCTLAHIYPDTICATPNASWSGASLKLDGQCTGDSVVFSIKNIGTDNMLAETSFIIIEDAVMYRPEPIKLDSGQVHRIAMKANGSTFRLNVQQVANHPGESQPTIAIEGCGTLLDGGISTGYVTQFPEDEANDFIDIDCQENIGSWDPNDKQGFPKGYGQKAYIEENVDLEYLIRFQNTGTDTAFSVVILDTLSSHLNVSSIQTMASSHSYELEILKGNILKFSFDNIEMPDSNINEPASHGFVRYKVKQNEDLPLETEINNDAFIYFDFNDPVQTNLVSHTVGREFIQVVSVKNPDKPEMNLLVFPNPTSDVVRFEMAETAHFSGEIGIFNPMGELILNKEIESGTFELNLSGLDSGVYFYSLQSIEGWVLSGRIMVLKSP